MYNEAYDSQSFIIVNFSVSCKKLPLTDALMSSVFENLGANLVLDDDMETFCHSELESDPFILVGTALFHTITFKCFYSIVPMTEQKFINWAKYISSSFSQFEFRLGW